MKFIVDRLLLVRMLKAVRKRAPLRGRPQKMLKVSAVDCRVFVEANGKIAGTEALVLVEGSCGLVHATLLRLLRSFARGRTNILFETDPGLFRIDEGNWPLAEFSDDACLPQKFMDFPMTGGSLIPGKASALARRGSSNQGSEP